MMPARRENFQIIWSRSAATRSFLSPPSVVVRKSEFAATGHLILATICMKACIYQKQEPVYIPRSRRTAFLKGFWGPNPGFRDLRFADRGESAQSAPSRFQARDPQERRQAARFLLWGSGPAGFTLAHLS